MTAEDRVTRLFCSRQMRPSTPDDSKGTVFKESKEKGVKMCDIGKWALEYNKMNKNKIRIQGKLVRYTIPDVMTVYMGIGGEGEEDVVVETIRVFGPREQASEIYVSRGRYTKCLYRREAMSNLAMGCISK